MRSSRRQRDGEGSRSGNVSFGVAERRNLFQGEKALKETWLTAILKNKIIDYYRKKKTSNAIPLVDEDGNIQTRQILR